VGVDQRPLQSVTDRVFRRKRVIARTAELQGYRESSESQRNLRELLPASSKRNNTVAFSIPEFPMPLFQDVAYGRRL
jgi:hypothetical protein